VKFVSTYKIQHNFIEFLDLFQVEREIESIFKSFFDEKTGICDDNDIVSMKFTNEFLDRPIYINARKCNWNHEDFLNKIFKISQSNTQYFIDGNIQLELTIVKKVSGSGKRKAPVNIELSRKKKKSVVVIHNNDNGCGYMAIALAKIKADGQTDRKEYQLVVRNCFNRLTNLGSDLASVCNLDFKNPLCINDLVAIDKYLKPKYQLMVINGVSMTLDFRGELAERQLYIEFLNNHYNTVNSIPGYFDCKYFCAKCFKGYQNIEKHKCPNGCEKCHSEFKCVGEIINCKDCHRDFNGYLCLKSHRQKKNLR